MKTTPNHGLSYVEGNDKPADWPLISQENMTKLDTLIQQLIDGKASLSHTHNMGQVNGLDTALDGKAPTTHTHNMGQVNGLDTALAGKATASTLDARVPSNMALRLDTTVGTRIFSGTTMIHGDTGFRRLLLKDTIPSASSGTLYFRRVNSSVILQFIDFRISEPLLELPGWVPAGFRPGQYTYSEMIDYYSTNRAMSRILGTVGTVQFRGLSTGISYQTTYSYHTRDEWPATLPGLPA